MNENVVHDSAFGEMICDCGLRKKESFSFWGSKHKLEIIAETLNDGTITDIQRKNYIHFRENSDEIFRKAEIIICNYVNDNYDELSQDWEKPRHFQSYKDFGNDVEPESVFFSYNGEILLLLEATWDEDGGLGVKVFPEYDAGPQNLFL